MAAKGGGSWRRIQDEQDKYAKRGEEEGYRIHCK